MSINYLESYPGLSTCILVKCTVKQKTCRADVNPDVTIKTVSKEDLNYTTSSKWQIYNIIKKSTIINSCVEYWIRFEWNKHRCTYVHS